MLFLGVKSLKIKDYNKTVKFVNNVYSVSSVKLHCIHVSYSTLYEGFEQVSGRFIPVISYSAKHFNVTVKDMYCSFMVLHVPVLQTKGGLLHVHVCTHFQTPQFVKKCSAVNHIFSSRLGV